MSPLSLKDVAHTPLIGKSGELYDIQLLPSKTLTPAEKDECENQRSPFGASSILVTLLLAKPSFVVKGSHVIPLTPECNLFTP